MISLLFALQALQRPDPPEIVRLNQRLAVLQKIDFDKLGDPLLKCIRQRADATRPERDMLGNQFAATKAANGWMMDCRAEDTRNKVIAALRKHDAALSETEASTIAVSGLGLVEFVVLMLANQRFKIGTPDVPSSPVEIPRSQENDAQD